MIRFFSQLLIFLKLFWHRFNENKLNMAAGYLTYSTMLALVPLMMVVLAIFSAFPVFSEVSGQVQSLIFDNFAPETGGVVQQYLNEFVANSKKMSGIGIIGLIVVALMLISSIDRTLNDIWPNTNSRTPLFSFAMYWMILTLGPLFLAVSLIVSSYIFSIQFFSHQTVMSFGTKLLSLVPFILTWLAFTLIYTVVPNTKVNLRYAMIGALVAAIFFTLGKKGFTWYMTAFPSYQLIYGALATLPILLLWIQLSWTFVLLGAQLTAVLEDLHLVHTGQLDLHKASQDKQQKLSEELQRLKQKIATQAAPNDGEKQENDRIDSKS
ncbi:virulence factor BrkB family protein [Pasteurellaceae bacterium USgator11]|nr:virulence factor BrkB family protein [Pasteurellaceae bacterium UScroc12]TNG98769.1 virulence factor BrkB family protein [Pasteurellaceae bacterium USgator41]TNH01027.1 virulence factor BrkB family protein [Pasteurellaceae bacterium UScroc31]TNH02810.1 virulence factor BrkB family protein [Pasteurellaceae bacterium USgator11]